MAISFIGSTSANAADGGNCTLDLTTITGLAEDDIVIVAYSNGDNDNVNENMSMVTSGYAEIADLFSSDNRDTNLGVFWKAMGASVDTDAVTTGVGGTDSANSAVCMVFRDVDTVTPMDVTRTTATGTNTHIPNPPSIDFDDADAWVVTAGAGAHASGGGNSYTAPANYDDMVSTSQDDTTDSIIGLCYRPDPADPEDPGVWTTSAADSGQHSWCACTMALRPAILAVENDRSGDDGIFMLDPDLKFDHDKLLVDSLFLQDFRRSTIQKIIDDFLFMGPQTLLLDIERFFEEDTILFADDRASDHSLYFLNNLLLLDRRASERLSSLRDQLLLGDAATADYLRGPISRAAADGVLMLDQRFGLLEKAHADQALLGSDSLKELLLRVSDFLLLYEEQTIQGPEEAVEVSRTVPDTLFIDPQTLVLDLVRSNPPDTLLLEDERISVLERQVIDRVLLADFLIKTLDRLKFDALLLGDDVITAATGVTSRAASDAILLASRSALILPPKVVQDSILFGEGGTLKHSIRYLADRMLVADIRTSVVDKLLAENLLVIDTVSAERTTGLIQIIEADGLFLDDALQLQRLHEANDFLLLYDDLTVTELAIVLRAISDQLLLADERLSKRLFSTDDELLLKDERSSERLSSADDQILLSDQRLGERLASAEDSLLFSDQRSSKRTFTAEDKLLLADFYSRARLVALADNLLLSDQRALLSHHLDRLDGLLLDDEALISKTGIQLRSAADALLLSDQRISGLLAQLDDSLVFSQTALYATDVIFPPDQILLDDAVNFETLKVVLDNLLLFDEFTIEEVGIVIRSATDRLLLADEQVRRRLLTDQDKVLLAETIDVIKEAGAGALVTRQEDDTLLLASQKAFAYGLAALDELLLSDEVSIAQIGIALRSVADSLLVGDVRTSIREMRVVDRALVSDAAEKIREAIATDDVMLVDVVSAFLARTVLQDDKVLLADTFDFVKQLAAAFEDDVMFGDFALKARELTQDDRLLLLDSVSTLYFEALAQALLWALLRARDLLGITTTWRDNFLGSKIDDRDYLSLASGYLRMTDLRVVYVN